MMLTLCHVRSFGVTAFCGSLQFQETKKIAQENKATENQAGVMELIKESEGLLRHDDKIQW